MGNEKQTTHYSDVTEHDIQLNQHDIDHLNDGQPVFKGIGEDVRLVLRPVQPGTGRNGGDDADR